MAQEFTKAEKKPLLDRKTLAKLSIERFNEQAKSIKKDIQWDCAFIEEKLELLPKLVTDNAKKQLEQQIAERKFRVDNLHLTLQMIAFMQDLLEQERKRLA